MLSLFTGLLESQCCAFVYRPRPDVGCHYDDGIPEINPSAKAVSKASIFEYLQEDIKHVMMSLLYLVKEDYGVRLSPDLFSKLSTLFITDVSRRGSHQPSGNLYFFL